MTLTHTTTFLSLATAAALAACGGGAASTTPVGNQTTPVAAAGSIRAIDWQNRTYESGDGTFTVVNGELEFAYDEDGKPVAPDYEPKDPDGYVERGSFSVGPPIYGDLTGDGVEEAVIVTFFNGGGTGRFSGIDVYGMRDGKEVVIGGIPGGDRGDGGIDDVKLDGAVVVVGRLMSGDGDGACCPSKLARERWRWDGSKFVEDEAARQIEDFGEPI